MAETIPPPLTRRKGRTTSSARLGRRPKQRRPLLAQSAALSDSAPSRYIVRIRTDTGKEIPGPIEPDELLVHAHRDRHLIEVGTQFLASRLIEFSGNEERVRWIMRQLNSMGDALAECVGWALNSPELRRRVK